MSSFISPLLPWQTRLVELLPGDELQSLQCRLEVVEITAQEGLGMISEARLQDYEALSCPWTPTERQTSLTCNGISIEVSSTLSQALRYLRQEDGSRWIWCDALCINFEDLDERSIQMQNSFLIFEKAASVIWMAWCSRRRRRYRAPGDRIFSRTEEETRQQNSRVQC